MLKDTEQFVSRAIQAVNGDLDWEVKVSGLELAQVFSAQTLSQLGLAGCPYSADLSSATRSARLNESLQIFQRVKLFEFLFGALCDCDRPVAQKACEILLALKAQLCDDSPTDRLGPGGLPAEVHSLAQLETTVRTWMSQAQTNPSGDGNGVSSQEPHSVLLVLGTVDLEGLRAALDKSSDHIEKSPQSLLQDILATVGTLEENEADCY